MAARRIGPIASERLLLKTRLYMCIMLAERAASERPAATLILERGKTSEGAAMN